MDHTVAAVRRSATSELGITPSDLCEHHGARVYKFATMVAATRQDADDLAQDALERAIRGLARFDPSRGQIEGWLWRIVVNAARDAGRVAKRQQSIRDRLATLTARPSSPIPSIPEGVRDLDLLAAIRELNPRQRALIALRFGADLDFAQVGEALGISGGAATVAVHRALTALRARLDSSKGKGDRS